MTPAHGPQQQGVKQVVCGHKGPCTLLQPQGAKQVFCDHKGPCAILQQQGAKQVLARSLHCLLAQRAEIADVRQDTHCLRQGLRDDVLVVQVPGPRWVSEL